MEGEGVGVESSAGDVCGFVGARNDCDLFLVEPFDWFRSLFLLTFKASFLSEILKFLSDFFEITVGIALSDKEDNIDEVEEESDGRDGFEEIFELIFFEKISRLLNTTIGFRCLVSGNPAN